MACLQLNLQELQGQRGMTGLPCSPRCASRLRVTEVMLATLCYHSLYWRQRQANQRQEYTALRW